MFGCRIDRPWNIKTKAAQATIQRTHHLHLQLTFNKENTPSFGSKALRNNKISLPDKKTLCSPDQQRNEKRCNLTANFDLLDKAFTFIIIFTVVFCVLHEVNFFIISPSVFRSSRISQRDNSWEQKQEEVFQEN